MLDLFNRIDNCFDDPMLQKNWSKIIKGIYKIISFLMKSSSVMINNLSHIIGKLMKHDKNFSKLKNLIIKFLNESFNRHKKFMAEVNIHKKNPEKNVMTLIDCIENLIEISQIESECQGTLL